jgi:hypothetical protein
VMLTPRGEVTKEPFWVANLFRIICPMARNSKKDRSGFWFYAKSRAPLSDAGCTGSPLIKCNFKSMHCWAISEFKANILSFNCQCIKRYHIWWLPWQKNLNIQIV